MVGLLEFSRKAKHGALQMKHERDVVYKCYSAMRAHVPVDQLSSLPELWLLSLMKEIFKVTAYTTTPIAISGSGDAAS